MVYILMKENTFNFFSDDYAQSRMTYDSYSKQINDIKTKLIMNEQEMKVLHVKNENAKVGEEMQAKKVRSENIM